MQPADMLDLKPGSSQFDPGAAHQLSVVRFFRNSNLRVGLTLDLLESNVSMWPIDRLIAYARNSLKIPERAVDKVAPSIKEFGWGVLNRRRQGRRHHLRAHAAVGRKEAQPPVSAGSRRRQSDARAGEGVSAALTARVERP
jgi:hypothetical protein